MTKLDEVKADCVSGEIVVEALTLYQAILEKRVLLVPCEPSAKMLENCGTMENYDFDHGTEYACADQDHIAWYKAITQAVDTEKLIEELK